MSPIRSNRANSSVPCRQSKIPPDERSRISNLCREPRERIVGEPKRVRIGGIEQSVLDNDRCRRESRRGELNPRPAPYQGADWRQPGLSRDKLFRAIHLLRYSGLHALAYFSTTKKGLARCTFA